MDKLWVRSIKDESLAVDSDPDREPGGLGPVAPEAEFEAAESSMLIGKRKYSSVSCMNFLINGALNTYQFYIICKNLNKYSSHHYCL